MYRAPTSLPGDATDAINYDARVSSSFVGEVNVPLHAPCQQVKLKIFCLRLSPYVPVSVQCTDFNLHTLTASFHRMIVDAFTGTIN